MTTRQKVQSPGNGYNEVGETAVNADGADYEYNLYKTTLELYPNSPSAGYELLRFGRVINTEHETLAPANAPLWRTVNYPGGKGWVNLAASEVKKFSDGDFPHWMGWLLVDDDTDSNSQCHSASILRGVNDDLSRMICHFPLEWNEATAETRYGWLKSAVPASTEGNTEAVSLSEAEWNELMAHIKALCFDTDGLGLSPGRVWHFEPRQFITHFRKCGWISNSELALIYPDRQYSSILARINITPATIRDKYISYINKSLRKYLINTPSQKSHFFAQGAVESYMMSLMAEGAASFSRNPLHASFRSEVDGYYNPPPGGYLDYLNGRLGNIENGDGPKFRGRGFKQLTGRLNYSKYWVYRGWVDITNYPMTYRGFIHPWWGARIRLEYAPIINNPHVLSTEPYCSIDASAWYWNSGSASAGYHSINKVIIEGNLTFEHSRVVTYAINGGYTQDNDRWVHSLRIFRVLGDGIR